MRTLYKRWFYCLPRSHLFPENPSGHIQTSGDIHVPLFSQLGSQRAVNRKRILVFQGQYRSLEHYVKTTD